MMNFDFHIPLTLLVVLGLATGCGDDGTSDGSTDSATFSGSASASASAEGGTADAGTTNGETADGTADGTADAGTTDAETTDGETTNGETTDGETGETGAPMGCGDLEETGCTDDPMCQGVYGRPLKTNGPDAPCLEPVEFLDCIDMMDCAQVETWFCVGGNSKPVLVSNSCGPANGQPCDPPQDPPPDCP